jgi:hypothetical protein
LDHDPQTLAGFADAALEKRLNAESFPNHARVYVGPAKREARRPGWNVKPGDFSQGIEDFFRDAITEIFLIVFGTKVGEWQNGDRVNLRLCFFGALSDL